MPPRPLAPLLQSPRPLLQRAQCVLHARYSLAPPAASYDCRWLRQHAQQPCLSRRAFSSSRPLFQSEFAKKNHYERLGVRHDASPADIKKSFYKLSKVHHPDANRKDPAAAHTFALISESYSLLSDPTRRATYDRDVLRLHQSSSTSSAAPRGSYHSAGGRPASGLSRRRGTYKGPPPSFYRSGGYGTHGEKRRAAHEETTTTGGSKDHGEAFGGKKHGGMGPGDDPFGHQGDVPHFDRASHHKTQKREDDRRWQRTHRAVDEDDVEFEPQMSMGAHFIVIIVLLGVSFVVPAMYLQFGRTGKKKKDA